MVHASSPSYLGGQGRTAWTQEVEAVVRDDGTTALQLGQQSETSCQKKGKWSCYTCYNMDESRKHDPKWKKPDTKGHMLYDSTYMKFPEKGDP